MKMNEDRDWLLTKANEEDNCIISVGGLACRVVAEANVSDCEITDEALLDRVKIAVESSLQPTHVRSET